MCIRDRTYSLSGTDSSQFAVSSSGVVTFSSAPDYENPADSNTDNVYEMTATVSDGSLSDSEDFSVTVTNDTSDDVTTTGYDGTILVMGPIQGATVCIEASAGTCTGAQYTTTSAQDGTFSLTVDSGTTGVLRSEGGFDPTWGYSHWADVMVGVTDVKPYNVDESAEFAISYDIPNPDNPDESLEISPGPSIARTDFLPNNKILFAEHTHAWASSDINGNDSNEGWPIFQYRSRLGLLYSTPKLVGISTGICGRVKIRIGDPELIGDVNYVTVKPDDSNVTNRYFLTSAQSVLSTLTPVGQSGYDGGQVAYVATEGGSVIVDLTSVYTGILEEYDIDENTKGEYICLLYTSDAADE